MERERLNRLVSGTASSSRHCFQKTTGMPSTPIALEFFSRLKCSFTLESETVERDSGVGGGDGYRPDDSRSSML